MNRTERDNLHYLCKEDPEFAIFYREFRTNHARPLSEHRIALCGLRGTGKRVLEKVLPAAISGNARTALSDRHSPEKSGVDHPSRRCLFIDDINDSPAGALAGAIGADWILYVHGAGQPGLAQPEIRFLAALQHRFPDLGRRLIMILHDEEGKPRETTRCALENSLAPLLPHPPRLITLSLEDHLMDGDRNNALRGEVRRQLDDLIACYPGGLAAARARAAAALLDSLDYFVGRAITRREQRLTGINDDLDQACALWRQDLLIVDDLLHQRITQNQPL
ncbi:hypothetical protein [Sodalis sp. C49]|uniref:hypothetical protein n=1 Tax=unclassified Sodalis (in: enterobacteria) TaxID=2636512 RepID=UPI003965D0F4